MMGRLRFRCSSLRLWLRNLSLCCLWVPLYLCLTVCPPICSSEVATLCSFVGLSSHIACLIVLALSCPSRIRFSKQVRTVDALFTRLQSQVKRSLGPGSVSAPCDGDFATPTRCTQVARQLTGLSSLVCRGGSRRCLRHRWWDRRLGRPPVTLTTRTILPLGL